MSETRTAATRARGVDLGTPVAVAAGMPTLVHEAPLAVLREVPGLVPALLRDALGIEVPAFATVDLDDAALTQAVPAELRADLVVQLRGDAPARDPVMGIVVEIQRQRDDRKRYSWPLYLAALRARLRCPTCLIVITADDGTARWAATPIDDLQPRSRLVPLVLGPDRMPRLTRVEAVRDPWLAVLSALVHGDRAEGTDTLVAAIDALAALPDDQSVICYHLLRSSLTRMPREALEKLMQLHIAPGSELDRAIREDYERHGARVFALRLMDRFGALEPEFRRRVLEQDDIDVLQALVLSIGNAPDRAAIEALVAALPPPAPDTE